HIYRRLVEDVIETIRVPISHVAPARRRVRESISPQIDKVSAPVCRTHIFKAKDLGNHRRRALSDSSRRAAADYEYRAFLAHCDASMSGYVVYLHIKLERVARSSWHYRCAS